MAQLVLLVIAAAWLAVLIPPMLRSRVENRPNSSVTDFRRQLTKLQHTATPPRGSARAIGRPLAPSPLARPAANGRPGQPTLRSGVTRQPSRAEIAARDEASSTFLAAPVHHRPERPDTTGGQPRLRTHGDPSGGHHRPQQHQQQRAGQQTRRPSDQAMRRDRRPASAPRNPAKQRRSNILFVLVITTACTLFLAATTKSSTMLYGFVLAFLALCGYVWMLVQARNGAVRSADDNWLR